MAPTRNATEDVLSLVIAKIGPDTSKNLCNLLAVSKGMQAAVVREGSNSNWTLKFHVKRSSDLARTARLAQWLQKYHMLVYSLQYTYFAAEPVETADDHAVVLSLGLRHPLQLNSIKISGVCPLKLLLQLDAQKLTCLRVNNYKSASQGFFTALAAEIGRMTNLQHLEMRCDRSGDATITWNFPSSLTGLTSLLLGGRYQSSSLQHVSSSLQHFECEYFMDDENLGSMHHLVHLTSLCLDRPYVTGTALTAAAQHLSRLKSLTIYECLGEQLQALRQMPQLQYLYAEVGDRDGPPLTAQDVVNIAYATSLTCLHLDIDDTECATVDLSSLSTLVQLQELVFSGKHVVINTFGNHTLDCHLTQLRQLDLDMLLHPQSLAQVLLATQLTSLHISEGVQGLSDGIVLGMVANMHNLQKLYIRCRHHRRRLAQVSVMVQSWLPNLRYLALDGLRGKVEGPGLDEWLGQLQHSRPDLKVVVLD
jgi:hypothetical protein